MGTANELVVSYLVAWNERDPQRRRYLVARTWTERGTYIDAHRRGDGVDSIDTMIGATRAMFPGYMFRLVSGIEVQNGQARFSWAAGGMPETPLYFGGTDFAVISSDGRFQSVAGFTDAGSAPAG